VLKPDHHPQTPAPRIGVLLINLGTPDAPTAPAVKRYLGEFLSDRRVVEIPAIAWQPILRGIVLNTRPKKSAHAYGLVWTEHGSPLARYTRAKAERLADAFWPHVTVDWAMRYGNPSIADRLTAMKVAGCERILLAPMYPQYCAATTATANDKAFELLSRMRWQPAIRTLPPYHDEPAYIDALKTSIERQLAQLPFEPQLILASFHGMPQRTLELGDPYHCHCQKTARLLAEALGRPLEISFQSRFGRAKWLEPATDKVLEALPGRGIERVAVVAPGFSVDCLETLEELAIRGRESFIGAGGKEFAYLSCLNDSEEGLGLLRALLARELAGWVPPS
jgi:ferrochelatase